MNPFDNIEEFIRQHTGNAQQGDPEFMRKFEKEFLPELQKRLDNDPKGRQGKILHAKGSMAGISVLIEDKNGATWEAIVDPINQTWMPAF